MHLAYFDENKYSKENPFFFIGGYLIPEGKILDLESTLTQIQLNFFGSSALRTDTEFHGKEMFHGKGHFKKRKLNERVQLFDDIGAVFGDYEKDEISRAILDFSEFKVSGSTPMYYGRALGRLIDTVYFTHSHHSRFLQVSDVLVYMAGRYENMKPRPTKWHDQQVFDLWEKIKANTDVVIQRWP